MRKELNKYTYFELIKYLKENNYTTYANDIEKSLFIDQSLVNLGFAKNPPYIIDININKNDVIKIINHLEILHDTDFAIFDQFLEVYDLMKEIIIEEKLW